MAIIRDYIDGQFKNDAAEPVGIGGFITSAILKEVVKLSRDVPTTYLEDGTHINDHIIRNPLTLSIEGVVSDVYVKPSPTLNAVRAFETQVGAVAQYLPGRTQSQISRIAGIVPDILNQIDALDRAIQVGQNVAGAVGFTGVTGAVGLSAPAFNSSASAATGNYGPVPSAKGKGNIEQFIDTMKGLADSDVLISIDASFRKYENMAITSISYTRDNKTKSLSFSIEAQQLRFAQTLYAQVSAPAPAGGLDGQTSAEADKGSQEGEDVEQSFLSYIL